MRRSIFGVAAAMAISAVHSASAQSPEDALKTYYAVKIVKTTPFQKPFTGYGIYLGNGAILTAAHIIGPWGFLKDPHVLIADQSLPAQIVKEGSVDKIDLMLLSVDEKKLPIAFRLRRNPICKQLPRAGEDVIVVNPAQLEHSRILPAASIHPDYQAKYGTLISEPHGSGSGVFETRRKCLMGIVTRAIEKFAPRDMGGETSLEPDGVAGYFVPASDISDFLPKEYRF